MDIAVPSWVIPGTYAENLRFLDPMEKIQTVELLFFLYDDEVRSLLDEEWAVLKAFGGRFRFTAHLPDQIQPKHEELVERLSPLVSHFIVHPRPVERVDEFSILLGSWIDRYDSRADDGRPRFLLENTQRGRLEAALADHPRAGICFDTGHWLLQGASPAAFIDRYRDRIGELHLHAVDEAAAREDGKLADHRSLRGNEVWLDDLVPFLLSFRGVVDLEVFSWAEAAASLGALETRGLVPERMQR